MQHERAVTHDERLVVYDDDLETGREDPAIKLAREVLKPGREATPTMRRLAKQILV
jgi:hypothetical protein